MYFQADTLRRIVENNAITLIPFNRSKPQAFQDGAKRRHWKWDSCNSGSFLRNMCRKSTTGVRSHGKSEDLRKSNHSLEPTPADISGHVASMDSVQRHNSIFDFDHCMLVQSSLLRGCIQLYKELLPEGELAITCL